jgi:hypothetical protein
LIYSFSKLFFYLKATQNLENAKTKSSVKENRLESKRQVKHLQFGQDKTIKRDDLEDMINEFINFSASSERNDQCPLLFWKANEQGFKSLANSAKKYLRVPASSAAVERMFSISGHILSSKRSKMSVKQFALLVFLKLNKVL